MTPAQTKIIELVRELIGKYDASGEFMEFQCPICGGDEEFDAVLVAQSGSEESDLKESRVFCQCHGGDVELEVEYKNLSIDDDLRQLELALVALDVEDAGRQVKAKPPVWEGEFGDAQRFVVPVLAEHLRNSPVTVVKNIGDYLASPLGDIPVRRRRRRQK